MNNRYIIMKELGNGTFSSVWKALHIETNNEVAIKIFNANCSANRSALREISLFKFLRLRNKAEHLSKFIISYLWSFEYEDQWCIVLELLSVSLLQLVNENRNFDFRELQTISRCILSGLEYLHVNGVIHADLKTNNVVVKNVYTMECKIIDLGSSVMVQEALNWGNNYTMKQHHLFRAPEIYFRAPFDTKIDIFCVGLILAKLCTKQHIFNEMSNRRQVAKMVEYLGLPPKILVENSKNGRLFFDIRKSSICCKWFPGLVRVIPSSRKLQSFFKNYRDRIFINFLHQCFNINPAKRESAKVLRMHPWFNVRYS